MRGLALNPTRRYAATTSGGRVTGVGVGSLTLNGSGIGAFHVYGPAGYTIIDGSWVSATGQMPPTAEMLYMLYPIVAGAGSHLFGIGSRQIAFIGAGTGYALVAGAAAVSIFSGSGVGRLNAYGTASVSIPFVGAGKDDGVYGAGSVVVRSSGVVTGIVAPRGSASGSMTFAGDGAGIVAASYSGGITAQVVGSGAGVVGRTGAGNAMLRIFGAGSIAVGRSGAAGITTPITGVGVAAANARVNGTVNHPVGVIGVGFGYIQKSDADENAPSHHVFTRRAEQAVLT